MTAGKKIVFSNIMIVAIITAAAFGLPMIGYSETQPALLADKHKAAGITCDGCHKEIPPKQKVPASVCMGCHGDYSAMGTKTANVVPNPHDTHMGELDCDQCHRVHKRSINICGQCHDFNLRVP